MPPLLRLDKEGHTGGCASSLTPLPKTFTILHNAFKKKQYIAMWRQQAYPQQQQGVQDSGKAGPEDRDARGREAVKLKNWRTQQLVPHDH